MTDMNSGTSGVGQYSEINLWYTNEYYGGRTEVERDSRSEDTGRRTQYEGNTQIVCGV